MKNYFDFELEGKRFLPVWLVFLVLVVLPFGYSVKMLVDGYMDGALRSVDFRYPFFMLAINVVSLLISFFIIKFTILGIRYTGREVRFEGHYGTFLGSIISAGKRSLALLV